jgi:hypothetical protein
MATLDHVQRLDEVGKPHDYAQMYLDPGTKFHHHFIPVG